MVHEMKLRMIQKVNERVDEKYFPTKDIVNIVLEELLDPTDDVIDACRDEIIHDKYEGILYTKDGLIAAIGTVLGEE